MKKPSLPSDKKLSPEDLEKTLMDLDVREMENAALNETLIFKSADLEEEKTALHSVDAPEDHSSRIEQGQAESIQQRSMVEEQTGLFPIPEAEEPEQTPTPSLFASRNLERRIQGTPVDLQARKNPVFQWVLPAFPLLFLLIATFEAAWRKAPLLPFLIIFTLLSLGSSLFFIMRKKEISWGFDVGLASIFILFSIAARKYGNSPDEGFSVLGLSPSFLAHFLFLFVLGLVALRFVLPKIPLFGRIPLLVLIGYGALGWIENIFRSLLWARPIPLEETLFGSPLWAWIPSLFFRPILFSLLILIPLLLLVVLAWKFMDAFKSRSPLSQAGVRLLVPLLFSFALGNLILENQRFPNLFSLIFPPPSGVGQVHLYHLDRSSGQILDRHWTLSLIKPASAKISSLVPYKIAAGFVDAKETRQKIRFALRNPKRQAIARFPAQDLLFLQDQRIAKGIQIQLDEKRLTHPRTVALFFDRSATMSALIPSVEKGVLELFSFLQSRDRLLWGSFSEEVKTTWISGEDKLKKELAHLFGHGKGNLLNLFERALSQLEGEKEKTLLLIASSEAQIPEDQIDRIARKLRASRIDLVLIGWGPLHPSLKSLAERSQSEVFQLKSADQFRPVLLGVFAEHYGEYEVSY